MKIPFSISVIIIWVLNILSIIAQIHVFIDGVDNLYFLIALVNMAVWFSVGIFFITTGIRVLRISTGMQKAKFRRV